MTIEIDEAVKKIEQYVKAHFTDAPLAYDNEPAIQRTAPYVRLAIRFGDAEPNFDSTFERRVGVAMAVVRVPRGMGSILPHTLARKVARVLNYRSIDGVRLSAANFVDAGIVGENLDQDAGWYQVNVNVPFFIEQYNPTE